MNPTVTTENLTLRFGDTCAIDDLTVSIASEQITGLLGRNRAGTALSRLGWILFIPFLVVALAPAVTTELLLTNTFGGRSSTSSIGSMRRACGSASRSASA